MRLITLNCWGGRMLDELEAMPVELAHLPRVSVPLLPFAPMGVSRLRAMLNGREPPTQSSATIRPHANVKAPPLSEVVDQIEKSGRGVIMTMGKGGVGKTTVAAAIAIELAHRGHKVHLSTTDPAAHVAATVDGAVPGLSVSRIDPAEETRRYSEGVVA